MNASAVTPAKDFVIPAQAGIQYIATDSRLDSGLRRNDEPAATRWRSNLTTASWVLHIPDMPL
jgi:hypothetical protein